MKIYLFANLRFIAVFLISFITSVDIFAQSSTQSYFISTSGSDQNDGSISHPLATLEAVRSISKSLPAGAAIKVFYRAGEYVVNKSFSMSPSSWDTSKTLAIASAAGENVIIRGGSKFVLSDCKLVQKADNASISDQYMGHIYQLDLKSKGFIDTSVMKQVGFGHVVQPVAAELFINDEPQVIARIPNTGYYKIGDIIRSDSASNDRSQGAEFKCPNFGSPTAKLNSSFGPFWVSGVFNVGWQDETAPAVATDSSTIRLEQPTIYGVKSSLASTLNSDRDRLRIRGFYIFNNLRALDTVNEYFIDKSKSILYFWPKNLDNNSIITISSSANPFLVAKGISNVTITGLHFEAFRGDVIVLNTCRNFVFKNDSFSGIGNNGLVTKNCTAMLIDSSEFRALGATGVVLDGGDRHNLISSDNAVRKSKFITTGRVYRSFSPAIRINGVGATISDCSFQNMTGQAILYQGNNHLIENNNFDSICTGFSDVGAVGTGRDPSSTGTVINNNFFKDISCNSDMLVTAVYIDDGSGGITVSSNVFLNCGTGGNDKTTHGLGAIHINGGSNNQIDNNIFVNCKIGISGGAWDENRWATYLKSSYVQKTLTQDVDVSSPLYQSKYPYLKGIFDANRTRENFVVNSLFFNVITVATSKSTVLTNYSQQSVPSIDGNISKAILKGYLEKSLSSNVTSGWKTWSIPRILERD